MGKTVYSFQHLRCVISIGLFISSTSILANQNSSTCSSHQEQTQSLPVFKSNVVGETQISADQTQILNDGISRFLGNVVIEQNQLRLTADNADFNKKSNNISLSGDIHLDTKTFSLNAKSGSLSLEDSTRKFNAVQFLIPNSNLRGEAEIIQSTDDNTSYLSKALITSCPITKTDWSFKARKIAINHEEEYGYAKNAVLDFKGVPLFYLPYLEFPLGEERRSGLLSPSFSSSSSRGFEIAVPWYWNIAPNQDATIIPRRMGKRGTSIETKYRYLTQLSQGELDVSYLNNDKQLGVARHYVTYEQNTQFNKKTQLNIEFRDVSDVDYNNDFSNSFDNNGNQTYLDREISLNYNSSFWKANVLAHTAETINASLLVADRPYRRLPQLQFEAEIPHSDNLTSFIVAEAVQFGHEDSAAIVGNRYTVRPGIRYATEGEFWHFRSDLELHHTIYDTNKGRISATAFSESRTLPITSIDAGLYFERETDNGLLQTLEPRIFYLNIPFKNQNNIPIFDSGLYDFKINQLFRNNRFNGNDLIGDANQLSLALTSRLVNPKNGVELFNASIGSILYFDDRQVTLSGSPETRRISNIIAELSSSIDNWKFQAGTQWNLQNDVTEKDNLSVQYRADKNNIFNISYRKNNINSNAGLSDVKHINTSFIAQVTNTISIFAQWDYSLKDNSEISALGGLIYDSCCWQLSLASHRFLLNDKNQEFDNIVLLQLSLKGFGGESSSNIKNTLKRAIPGYIENY